VKTENSETTQTDQHFRRLSDLITSHLDLTDDEEKPVTDQKKKPPAKEHILLLKILKPVPWILMGLFLISFYWDFNGLAATVGSLELRFEGLLRIITVSGMIGFLTNWIAVTMLFRPLHKRPLLGQGLIPAHKERIATRLAEAVSEDLINPDIIKKKIHDSRSVSRFREKAIHHIQSVTEKEEFREDLKKWLLDTISSLIQDPEFKQKLSSQIVDELDDALEDRIIERIALKTYSFLRGQDMREFVEELLTTVPVSAERNITAIDDYLDTLPERIEQSGESIDELITQSLFKLVNQLDVHDLVEENLRSYDERKLETMIRNATNEQLKTIQYLGAILGTIGGFVIWEPLISMGVLATLFGALFLLDRALYQ
jgi:uncharacterized membrane protein YheB (UPF0754 family)